MRPLVAVVLGLLCLSPTAYGAPPTCNAPLVPGDHIATGGGAR